MTNGAEPIIELDNLTKYYESRGSFIDNLLGRKRLVKAVDGVDLQLYPGETLGVVGESGCGKTTLGRSMIRLIEPTEGSVYYRPTEAASTSQSDERIDLTTVSRSRIRSLRKDLQYIFQDPFSSLNPRLTVGDIVGEPLDIHNLATGEERTRRIHDLLETVGLSPSHAYRYPHEFSGGQRQRIGIARALAVDPEVIICDEPVSALDVSIQAQILNLLEDLQDEFDLSYIFIAHDLSVVEHISDRVAVMYLGEIAEIGPSEQVFSSPKHPYTEALLSVIPEPDPLWEGQKVLLAGEVPSPIDPPSGCRFHPRCHRVIQPDAYDLDQPNWRRLMNLRLRVHEAESINELVVTMVHGEQGLEVEEMDRLAMEEAIRAQYELPDQFTDPEAERRFTEAMDRFHEEGLEPGRATLDEAFTSPCEQTHPDLVEAERDQEVACLLYGTPEGERFVDASSPERGDAVADD